ncbi:chromosome segregation protein SMC [Croceicoccus gelatinilyticus]|uniref:chromosome segregation protein SMC n=1 Tax=Croceicoccus gelatinilyticus TaxID=2835536 RepID=UPI001BD15AF6|nr:chromosome segregation protein SMC [Croceicoccus gelatinilyticus]MBS7670558.1 chromosome segregation protein SMC [Croceicoccus gelatinilyticus]
MRFRRLRLSGFKSFVEPADLLIEPGLTGVVGPNGCGKSNLLEAIRWVMGESSPKSMRGSGMEDVIFAGTESRKARSFAEVVLLAETDAGQEMEVTRRIERGAGSAYRLNGRDVRAKDVALVFADAATGAHSPALVSQGRIAAVIAAKPAERRQMLEEAAGIAGLHVRRKDAEQKLRATETNLARLDDILSQLDTRIGALKRQARAAEKYKELSAQIRTAEARVLYAKWREAAAAADAAKAQAKAAEEAVLTNQAATNEAQGRQRAAAEALAKAREEMADRRDDLNAQANMLAVLTGKLEAAEEKLADLDRQRARLDSDEGDANRTTKDAAEALSRLERDVREAEKRLAEDEQRRPSLINEQEKAESAQRTGELALAQATAELARVEADWRVAEAAVGQARGALARLEQELTAREAQDAALGDARELDLALQGAQARCGKAEGAVVTAREALEKARADREAVSNRRDGAASTLAAAKAELAGVEREHDALDRDRRAREKADKGSKGRKRAIDAVKAAPGYERALAAALGRDAAAPLGKPEQGQDGRFWTGADAPKPVADSLAAHVRDAPEELTARLAMVRVVESDDGQALAPGEWLVTKAGALRRWDGFVARGEGAAEAARLEAANRLEALAQQLPALREAVDAAAAQVEAANEDLSAATDARIAAERAVNTASEEERAALRARDQAENAVERHARAREELAERMEDLHARLAAAQQDVMQAEERRRALPDPSAQQAALETARSRNDAARTALQSAMAQLASLDQALAVGRERTKALQGDMKGWEARAGDAAKRLADMTRRREEIEEERAVTAARPEALMREIELADKARDRLAGELTEAEAAHTAAEAAGKEADTAFTAANEALASAREIRAGAAARAENEEARRSEMARQSGDRFQCPPPLLPERLQFESATVRGAEAEGEDADRLIAQRERLGPVNLVAADELVEAEAEHGASLTEQQELAEAVHRLRGSIGSLNREGRERLRAAFEAVDTHFQSLFTTLFGGGQAHLALIDSDDPLEAGLEIYAQPPGKKLQSLTLLSGGEQALTAVALIFALFLTNPAPICVLDEVDAPLDDANIERFCDLLDAMSKQTDTRYLIVTHNAVTMSRMHRLFGVTMVEQGVSRLVSVDLGGAEELLAAE